MPPGGRATTPEEGLDRLETTAFPVIIRPALTLGGTGGGIAYNRKEFEEIIRRGLDLPAGETDPTRAADEPAAHYYNVAEGAKYLNLVLDMSLRDNTRQTSAVALAAIKSLQNLVGQSNLFSVTSGPPPVSVPSLL